jgi:TPR repeat protein
MNQRPTLDSSTFERLLLAAWILQSQSEAKVRAESRREIVVGPLVVAPARIESVMPSAGSLLEEPASVQPTTAGDAVVTAKPVQSRMPPFAELASEVHRKLHIAAQYRLKVRIKLSPRRALATAAMPVLATFMLAMFTFVQLSRQSHVNADNAAPDQVVTRSDENSISAPRLSHNQITDAAALRLVQGLSRYEIPSLRRQANFGDDSAALAIAMLYETGRYVPQSCAKAAAWVEKSASWGNAAAQYNLGLRYRQGDGVAINETEAERWFRKSADQRYAKAVAALGTGTAGEQNAAN